MFAGFDEEVRKILKRKLPLHKRRGKGGHYTYHKGSDVIRCLNEAFGHAWSSEKLEVQVIEDQVLMLVALTAMTKQGDAITHHGYGSAPIARSTSDRSALDIGNTYKSAFTSALKKAAEQFGIGLGDEEGEDRADPSPVKDEVQNKPPMRSAAPRNLGNAGPTNGAGGGMRRPTRLPPRDVSNNQSKPATKPSTPTAPAAAVPGTSSDLNTPITGVQIKALANLARMKGKEEAELLKAAEIDKQSFDALTKEEAIIALRFAQTI